MRWCVCCREDVRDCLSPRADVASFPVALLWGRAVFDARHSLVHFDLISRFARSVATSTRAYARSWMARTTQQYRSAGIERLGLEHVVTEWLEPEMMLPALVGSTWDPVSIR